MRECISGIENVVGKTRRQRREFFADCGETRFLVRGEVGAAKPEVAQFVLDDRALRAGELRHFRRCAKLLEFFEQPLVLAEFGVKLGHLWQVRVIDFAQFGTVHHRVQVPDLSPCAVEFLGCVLQGCRKILPVRLRARSGELLDHGAAGRQHFVDRGCHIRGLEGVEARQAGKVEQRVHRRVLRVKSGDRMEDRANKMGAKAQNSTASSAANSIRKRSGLRPAYNALCP